jgi:hypothetical protein
MKKYCISEKKTNPFKKNTYRLSTEPNYAPHNTEHSKNNNHLSTQATTGDTKYLQTEKNRSPRLIHKEKPKQKDKKTTENKIYDLDCTLKLNLKIIQDIIKSGQIPKLNIQQIKKLQTKIEKITQLINERSLSKKEKENCYGKKLVTTQFFQEAKRRKEEKLNFCKNSYEEYIGFSKKKDITIRKCHKKFTEIQTYIRRESKSFHKYRRMYGNFSMDNFILENENMLRMKEKLNKSVSQINTIIPILLKEIEDMKNNKNENKINVNKINICPDQSNAKNKLENFMYVGEDILKDMENRNNKMDLIFNGISYQGYKNYYNNVLKYYNILNNDFSQSSINENIISGINPQNSVDNNDTNMSNLYYDIMNIGNNRSTFRMDDFSNIINSKFG